MPDDTSAYALMKAAIHAEVTGRGHTFKLTDDTHKALCDLAQATSGTKQRNGLMLCGPCGTGKTTTVYALRLVLAALMAKGLLPEDTGLAIADAKEIVATATDRLTTARLRQMQLLAIEDMGREPAEILSYGNIITPIADLIEYRYEKQLYTVITTNLAPTEIGPRYGDRVADRLNEMVSVVVFNGDSFRAMMND